MARGRRAPRLLEDRVRFETLLSDLFAGLIHVDASGLDAALENGLHQMVAFLGMDRGNLDEYIDGRPRVRVSWAEPGIAMLPSILAAERLHFQRLLSDLSARLANVSALDFEKTVYGALGAIRDFLGVERAELVEFSVHGGPESSWSTLGTSDMTRVPWLMANVRDGHVVCVSRLEELPDIKSLVALPLRAAGVVLGGLVVAAVAERAWPNELIDQLRLVGEAVANALASAQAEREAARLRQHLAHIGRVSAMGELTASLAHELNQPLTAILNNAE